MDFDPIDTARLRLLPISADEARAIVAGDLAGLSPAEGWPHDDTADGLSMAIEHGQPAGWMVTLEGEVIGDCGTHGPTDNTGTVEIGYGFAAPYRGRGYGSEVVRAITEWLLQQQGVRTVRASTLKDNSASRRVLGKADFRFIDFDEEDQAVYERDSSAMNG